MSKENSIPSLKEIENIYSLIPSVDHLGEILRDSETTNTLPEVPNHSFQTHNGEVQQPIYGQEINAPAYPPRLMPVSYSTEVQVGEKWADLILGARAQAQENITSQRQMEWK